MNQLIACSGPGAMDAIRQNLAIAFSCASASGVIFTAMLIVYAMHGRAWACIAVAAPLTLLHPAWIDGGIHGDCGYSMRDQSCFGLAIVAVLFIVQLLFSRAATVIPTDQPDGPAA
jgi:hypothetical protein